MSEQVNYQNKVIFKKAESPKDLGVRGYVIECMGDNAKEVMTRAIELKKKAEDETR